MIEAWAKGRPIDHAPESLRLYALCAALDYSVLPVAGGLYDQHPQLLDEWEYIIEQRALQQKREREKQEREAKRAKGRRK